MGDEEQPPLRHRPLFDLATAQHGVVSTRQLAAIGYTRSSASKAHGVGRLRRVHRGVYAVGHERLPWEGRCLAAVLACAPSVASHLTAAWIWGLVPNRPGTFHLTAPTKRHSKREFVVHSADLPEIDITEIDRIPVTNLPRTLLDLAATVSPGRLERALRRAEERQIFDLRPIDALLARTAGHHGASKLRNTLAIYRDDPAFTRSGLGGTSETR